MTPMLNNATRRPWIDAAADPAKALPRPVPTTPATPTPVSRPLLPIRPDAGTSNGGGMDLSTPRRPQVTNALPATTGTAATAPAAPRPQLPLTPTAAGTSASVRPAIGSVASQNFGTMASPPPAAPSRPLIQRPQVSLRGPDQMAEVYNAREDREARQKLASDLDSERFRLGMIAGEGGGRRSRAALEALGQNAQQRAALASGAEALSTNATQNRANRDNTLANTGMQEQGQNFRAGLQEQGQDRRAQLDSATRRYGADRGFDIARLQDDTERTKLDRPETLTGADGRIWHVGADGLARPVADAEGRQITGGNPRDTGDLTQRDVLDSLGNEFKVATDQLASMQGINGTATPEQVQAQQQYVQQLQAQIAAARAGGRAIPNAIPAAQPGNVDSGRSAPLAVGTVMQGYRFKGGDPANAANWEKAQ